MYLSDLWINNKLKNSNLSNEHALNREPVPLRHKKSTLWLFTKIDLFTDTAALLIIIASKHGTMTFFPITIFF